MGAFSRCTDAMDELPEPPPEAESPPFCATCYGAEKVFQQVVVDGRTRAVWMTCPSCRPAPQKPVKGP